MVRKAFAWFNGPGLKSQHNRVREVNTTGRYISFASDNKWVESAVTEVILRHLRKGSARGLVYSQTAHSVTRWNNIKRERRRAPCLHPQAKRLHGGMPIPSEPPQVYRLVYPLDHWSHHYVEGSQLRLAIGYWHRVRRL